MRTERALPLVLAAGLFGFGLGSAPWSSEASAGAAPAPAPTAANLGDPRGFSAVFQSVSERVGSSVVSVKAYEYSSRGRRRRRIAQGSGVFVRPDGILVTNHHVVSGADELVATLSDGRNLSAELLGKDAESDLAILRVRAEGLDYTPLSDRDGSVGEWVLAMGNPFGVGHTVTAGIIGGKGRADLGIAVFEDFIQTDAAIHPGNSGGPLVDLEGRVVGINTAVGTGAYGSRGFGFAIPSYMVRNVLESILQDGHVRRGWLGVQTEYLTDRAREAARYEGASRVAIDRVLPGTPAALGGLHDGDILLSIGGRRVGEVSQVLNTIGSFKPGAQVDIAFWREGRAMRLPITLSERQRPEDEE